MTPMTSATPGRDTRLPSRRAVLGAGAAALAGAAGLAGCVRWADPAETSPRASTAGPAVSFTVTGAKFEPVLELVSGSVAEVEWRDVHGSVLGRGARPTIRFGSQGPHTVLMTTAFDEVLTVNLGFDAKDDAGRYSLDPEYNAPAQPVSGVAGVGVLVNLRRFLAARTGLGGALDVSGLTRLEHVECFEAQVESVDLSGCTSLLRLCLERNRVRTLDLGPVADTLRDLRVAAQQGGSLDLVPLRQPLSRLYHFCVRDQVVTGHPSADQLPACEELWNWNCGQRGALRPPGAAHTLLAAGNAYTSVDCTGYWSSTKGWGSLDLTDNNLTAVVLTGCRSLQTIRLGGNTLGREQVDRVLAEIESWKTEGFELALDGTNAAPSAHGIHLASVLRHRGWDVSLATR